MNGFKEYDQHDGLGLAELVKRKEVSPKEMLEEAISRIEKLNPKLNAVILPMFDYARKLAQENIPDSPFAGVPFLLKDLLAAF
ncbi:MAG: amidase, partial [Deltaproteobacteria bacterium]|nr:amidase [Deltaproteobacteria bacterium]